MGVECQYIVAWDYLQGDEGFPKDIDKAEYWFKKALENGKEAAKTGLESIEF